MPAPEHGYTLESLVADSGRLPERSVLRLLVAIAGDAEERFRNGGLARGIVAADVVVDGEPEVAGIRETIPGDDPRRLASLAPEAAASGRATEKSIVFGLGLVAFHALSGAPAFSAPGAGEKRAAPVFELRGLRVSEATVDLLRRATSRDPGERPRKIRKLRRAAERVLKKTSWDGDRVARRAPRPSFALPAIALVTAAAMGALFWFRVGPFEIERVTEGFSRLVFGENIDDAGGADAEDPRPTEKLEAPRPEPETERESAAIETPAPEIPVPVAGADDFLLPREPSPEDAKVYREAMDKLAAARKIIETSAFGAGETKFASIREAMSLLEAARGLLERYGELRPEKRPTVERRMIEINQELMFCRKILPSKY